MKSENISQYIPKRHARLIKAEKRLRAWQRVLNGFFILYIIGFLSYLFMCSAGLAQSSECEERLNQLFEHALLISVLAALISRNLYCRIQYIESIKYFRSQQNIDANITDN